MKFSRSVAREEFTRFIFAYPRELKSGCMVEQPHIRAYLDLAIGVYPDMIVGYVVRHDDGDMFYLTKRPEPTGPAEPEEELEL